MENKEAWPQSSNKPGTCGGEEGGGERYTATLADPTNSALFMARPKYIITAT